MTHPDTDRLSSAGRRCAAPACVPDAGGRAVDRMGRCASDRCVAISNPGKRPERLGRDDWIIWAQNKDKGAKFKN